MAGFIRNIKLHIIQCFSDRNIRIILVNLKSRYKNGRFRRTVNIEKPISLRRFTGNELLPAYGKITETPAFHFQCKLSSDLCGHEGVGNAIFFKVFLQANEIQTDFFRNNM